MADKSAANGDRDTFIKSLDLFGPAPTGGGTGTTGGIRMFSAKDGPGMASDELTYMFGRGALRMEGFNEYYTQLQVRAGATKNASIQLGSRGVDAALVLKTAAPNVGLLSVGSPAAQMWFTGVNGNKGMSVGINNGGRSSAALDVDLKGTWSNEVGIRVRQQAGGTGNLFQAENSAGGVAGGFDKSGYLFTQLNAAPASSDITPGEANFWFDSTAGASRLVVTAKDTGGALVSGSIPLLPADSQTPVATPSNPGYDPVDGANVLSLGSGNDVVAGLETLDIIFGGPAMTTSAGMAPTTCSMAGLVPTR
jgi:hypothetical protein